MPQLFKFTSTITPQTSTSLKSFGEKTATTFRLTSSFDITAKFPAYAMLSGTVLLQQQAADPTKVNLFLKPDDQKDIKLPVKYVIYRGLDINDFLQGTNPTVITDAGTTVKTSGTELLVKMQVIQQNRAPGDAIPVEALFGNELTPLGTKQIDEFFFKNLAPTSQLFPVPGGIELGGFAPGEVGIEILLENPEFFPTVEMAGKAFFEQEANGSTAQEKKWQRDLIRHFADPAAFYGLHFDIAGGIEYRTGATLNAATTIPAIFTNILDLFKTKNTVYLDIRNENGYSYNYYGNYVGSGADADKELQVKPGASGTFGYQEYYDLDWPVCTVSPTPSTTLETNTFFLKLRVNDNQRPLVAGQSTLLPQAVAPDSDQQVKFIDESVLLPSPLPNPLPELTNDITVIVPNKLVSGAGEQIATIVRLDYIKQIRLNDGTDAFPYDNATDHLFGPVGITMPWDSISATQWTGSHHYKYYDGINQGFVYGKMSEAIAALDPVLKTIKINQKITGQVLNEVAIENTSHPQNVGTYHVVKVELTGATETTITVLETFPAALQSGDTLTFTVEAEVIIDYAAKSLIAKGTDLSTVTVFDAGKKVWVYTKKGDTPLRYVISSRTFSSGDTVLVLSGTIKKEGYGAIMETGFVVETDTVSGPSPVDRVLHYAVPRYYFQKTGVKDSNFFNYKGGMNNDKSFLDTLKERNPDFNIEKFSLEDAGFPITTLGYTEATVAKENILLLGISRSEWDGLTSAAATQLSANHLQMLKLIPDGNRQFDADYQAYYKYKVVISGLDSSGVYKATTSPLYYVFSRDNLIFTSEGYALGADMNALQLNQEERFHLNTVPSFYLDDYGEYIKKQNPSDPNSTYQYLYETLGAGLKTIVDDFRTAINALTATTFSSSIENLILTKGKLLLDTARTKIRSSSDPMYNKDGALYLARLQMRKAFKEQPLVANSFISLSKGEEYLDLLEKITRGLHATNVPDFSTHPTHIPILFTGFDPFRAIYKQSLGAINKEGLDEGYHLSNSSGNISLALDNTVLTHIPSGKQAILKGSVLPTRYREFDQGWVEDFYERYINPAHPNYQAVKMIITFSYGVESNVYDFEVERFASRLRGVHGVDNNLLPAGVSAYLTRPDKDSYEFIETNLPTDKLFILDKVGLDQKAQITYYNGNSLVLPEFSIDNPHGDDDLKDSYKSEVLFPNIANYPYSGADTLKALQGSGGDYLSNESFYRVAFLRKKYESVNPNLKTGHIHMGYLRKFDYQRGGYPEIPVDISKADMITVINQAITQAIEIL